MLNNLNYLTKQAKNVKATDADRNLKRIYYSSELKGKMHFISAQELFNLSFIEYLGVVKKISNIIKSNPLMYSVFMLTITYKKSNFNLKSLLNSLKVNGDTKIYTDCIFDVKVLRQLNYVLHRTMTCINLHEDVHFESYLLLQQYVYNILKIYYYNNNKFKNSKGFVEGFVIKSFSYNLKHGLNRPQVQNYLINDYIYNKKTIDIIEMEIMYLEAYLIFYMLILEIHGVNGISILEKELLS